MENTHSIFWNSKGGKPSQKVCDLHWIIGTSPQPTTRIASRPLQSFDFGAASSVGSEQELSRMLSQHCVDINDIPEATFCVSRRELPSNHVYRKICRNAGEGVNLLSSSTPMFPGEKEERIAFIHQLEILLGRIREVSQFIQLDDRNLTAFGDEIRNILILSCTEVEAIAKSVLSANGASSRNIYDFYKLERACKLSGYSVRFTRFPQLSEMKPYESWGGAQSDGRLPWYTSYNNVKHDRVSNLTEANLCNALNSMAGVTALLCASYGWPALRQHSQISDFVAIERTPYFDLSEIYTFTSSQIVENGKGRFVPDPVFSRQYPF